MADAWCYLQRRRTKGKRRCCLPWKALSNPRIQNPELHSDMSLFASNSGGAYRYAHPTQTRSRLKLSGRISLHAQESPLPRGWRGRSHKEWQRIISFLDPTVAHPTPLSSSIAMHHTRDRVVCATLRLDRRRGHLLCYRYLCCQRGIGKNSLKPRNLLTGPSPASSRTPTPHTPPARTLNPGIQHACPVPRCWVQLHGESRRAGDLARVYSFPARSHSAPTCPLTTDTVAPPPLLGQSARAQRTSV